MRTWQVTETHRGVDLQAGLSARGFAISSR
jgi:hypothetical protein